MITIILIMLVGLAVANGANDVSKGVATLAGAGVTAYRTAIGWGTITTAVGAVLSIQLGRGMGKLFSSGIFAGKPTDAFALAVLIGATSWVTLATVTKLPVSTTHAVVGSLVGAGLVIEASGVQWQGLVQKVLTPLLASVFVAYIISLLLAYAIKPLARRSADRAANGGGKAKVINVLHWITSGATSGARGLNDTPKIAAIGGFALIPAGYSANTVSLIVAVAMTAGSLLGIRVARRLGDNVIKLSHYDGFTANLTTASLVGLGGVYALPMTTTQVSTGSIAGTAGFNFSRLSGKTLRDFAIAWLVTPFWGAAVAALAMWIIA
jgi:inorganic phosphate transporter, PiT family